MSSAHRLAPFVAAVALIARAAAAAPSAASAPSFRDVANPLRCYDLYPSWGLSWADFDLDGTPDLWIANHVAQPGRLFRNRIDVFQPVHGAIEHAGQDDHFGGWADVDGDGDPDLYAANGAYQRSSLFENNNGVFVDRSEAHGLTARSVGRGRFAIWADFNGDGWSDLYLSNFYSPDQFYLNDRHGKLKDAYETSGISNNFQKDAACYGDVDGDGDEDVFLPLLGPRSILFINRGDGTFDSRLIDIGNSSHACALADFNGDGTLDLFVAGHDSDQLLLNDGRGGFTDASESAGLTAPTSGLRSVLVQDFDNDGSLD
ncbi:MAG: VCBS repeat-containing protein, partial [Elusimicrobia bacterium]|nr:VCBS repeat-containing protein [Elusimicrobiota bacterium]